MHRDRALLLCPDIILKLLFLGAVPALNILQHVSGE